MTARGRLGRLVRSVLPTLPWLALACGLAVKLDVWRPPLDRAYAAGDIAEPLPGVRFGDAQKSVLIYVRTTCRFCTESMAFYRRLVASPGVAAQKVQVVMISPEPDTVLEEYLHAQQLYDVRYVAGVHADVSRVPATPTLLVVDARGAIERVAVGMQDAAGEAAIERAVQTSS